jgi:hypothetical protein
MSAPARYALPFCIFFFLAACAHASDCTDACQADFDKWEKVAQDTLDAKDYYCGMTETNCGSRETTPSGQPDPCWAKCLDANCVPWSKCDADFQSCCRESARINDQLTYDQCVAACKQSEPSDPCAGVVCGTQTCVNGKYYAEVCVPVEGKATCEVNEQGKLFDFCPKEILSGTRAVFFDVHGNVSIKRKQGGTFVYLPVSEGTVAHDGDVIVAGQGALADLLFPDGFLLTVTENSEAQLDLSGKGVISEADKVKMAIIGHLNEMVVGKLEDNQAMITAGTRSAAIIEQDGDSVEFRLVEGNAWVADAENGVNVSLTAGQKVTKTLGQGISNATAYDSSADAAEINAMVGRFSSEAAQPAIQNLYTPTPPSGNETTPPAENETPVQPEPTPTPGPTPCGGATAFLALLGLLAARRG